MWQLEYGRHLKIWELKLVCIAIWNKTARELVGIILISKCYRYNPTLLEHKGKKETNESLSHSHCDKECNMKPKNIPTASKHNQFKGDLETTSNTQNKNKKTKNLREGGIKDFQMYFSQPTAKEEKKILIISGNLNFLNIFRNNWIKSLEFRR